MRSGEDRSVKNAEHKDKEQMSKGKVYVVGLGPGDREMMTAQAKRAIENSDIIVGYKVYTDLVRDMCDAKTVIESGMRQ